MRFFVLSLYLFCTTATAAMPAPEPTVEGNTLVWQAVDAITINVHTGSGDYLESIPGSATQWVSQYPGDYYLVSADHGDWRDWGRSETLSVGTQTTAVRQLRGLIYGPSSLEIFWSPPVQTTTGLYAIYRDDTLLETCSCTSFYEINLQPGTHYLYTVTPLDEDGLQAESSTVALRTHSLGGYDFSPLDLTATVYSSTAAELFWEHPDDPESLLSHYVVYRDAVPVRSNRIGNTTGSSFFDPSLEPCKHYFYHLEIRDIYNREALQTPMVEVETPGCETITSPERDRAGIWHGNTAYGYTLLVIDDNENVYGFSDDGAGRYRSILGNLTQLHGDLGYQQLYEFYFTDNDDESSPVDTFRLSDDDPNPATVPYAMGLDYPNLENYSPDSRFERFTLTIADENTLPLVELEDLAGNWGSRTVSCNDTSCNVYRISITLGSDGAMNGEWTFGDELTPGTHDVVPIEGTVAMQGQYLASDFEEALITTTLHKKGVIYRMGDRLLFNAFGLQPDGKPDAIVTLLSRSP